MPPVKYNIKNRQYDDGVKRYFDPEIIICLIPDYYIGSSSNKQGFNLTETGFREYHNYGVMEILFCLSEYDTMQEGMYGRCSYIEVWGIIVENYNEYNRNLRERDIQALNEIRIALEQTLNNKLTNAGIYFHSISRVKSAGSISKKLATGKYGSGEDDRKIQDLIGIRLNLFYLEDINICEHILEDTFMVDNWSKSHCEENRFEAQKCNGVFRIPSKYMKNISPDLWKLPFDKTFEVQLRTVLFEGWHEIEHEMRYKYKSDEAYEENSLWAGQEKNARVMNSIIASLELCDWSIVQVFDNIAASQYESKNWENALRCKYRLRITQDSLKPEIKEYFDNNPKVVNAFFAVTKHELVNLLLNIKYQKILSPNRVIYLINKEVVHDDFVSEQLGKEQFGRVLNKEIKSEIRPLVSVQVFCQKVLIPKTGYEKACEIIYEWAYQHIGSIFGQMTRQMEQVHYSAIGYSLDIAYDDAQFGMDLKYISNDEPGVIWHVTAELVGDEKGLWLSAKNICENIYSWERNYSRPKFMRDIFNHVGYIDAGIHLKENHNLYEIDLTRFKKLRDNDERTLPIVVVFKPDDIPLWAQDFDGAIINVEVLERSLAGICHVVIGNPAMNEYFSGIFGHEIVDGSVFFWSRNNRKPVIFSMEAIRESCFEEVNHSVDELEEYEKAFRYRLREMVCEEFVGGQKG